MMTQSEAAAGHLSNLTSGHRNEMQAMQAAADAAAAGAQASFALCASRVNCDL